MYTLCIHEPPTPRALCHQMTASRTLAPPPTSTNENLHGGEQHPSLSEPEIHLSNKILLQAVIAHNSKRTRAFTFHYNFSFIRNMEAD